MSVIRIRSDDQRVGVHQQQYHYLIREDYMRHSRNTVTKTNA